MSGFKDRGFGDRLNTARNAKRVMAAKFQQRPGLDDPAFVTRQAARVAVCVARDVRQAERESTRLAEKVRMDAKRVAHAAAEAEKKAAEEENDAAEKALSLAAREAELKKARDARYAARKARK
jgi:hypothetical protein